MDKVFEKIIEKFSNIHRVVKNDEDLEWNRAVYKCAEIVKQEAEQYNNVLYSNNMRKILLNVLKFIFAVLLFIAFLTFIIAWSAIG